MKITLCGSTRFKDHFDDWNARLSGAGQIVYTLSCFTRAPDSPPIDDDNRPKITAQDKTYLDLVHLAKIDDSDAIVVLNIGGYTGDSTRREIAWAKLRGKSIYYAEAGYGDADAENLVRYGPFRSAETLESVTYLDGFDLVKGEAFAYDVAPYDDALIRTTVFPPKIETAGAEIVPELGLTAFNVAAFRKASA